MQKGQALITLLFFSVIAITVTAAAVVILMNNALSGSKFQQGSIAYGIAQTGIENAKLRLLRDPNYTGETLPIGNGSAVITVSKSGTNYTIVSKGQINYFVRQITVQAIYSNNLFTVTSTQETY